MKKLSIILFAVLIISCDDIIEVQDISNETVTLLAPTNEAVLSTIHLTFSWEPIEDAESYELQIATPTFEDALQIVKDSSLIGTSFNTTLENNMYQWRIRAVNSGYHTDYSTQSFSIEE